MSYDTMVLLGVAGLLLVAVYIRHRELALGLLGALVALILYQRKPASLPSPPTAPEPRIEPERTAEKVQHEASQDDRSPQQLELDLERAFGRRPGDKL